MSYSSGNYGSDVDTTMVYLPVTAKRYFDWGSVALTMPYIWIESSGEYDSPNEPLLAPTRVPVSESASGFGDLVVKGRYGLRPQSDSLPGVDLVGKLKVPTADDDLGTGEADLGFMAESYYWLSRTWIAYLDLGINLLGDPPDRNYDNQWLWSLGAGYHPNPRWWHSAYLDYRTSAVDNTDDAASLLYIPSYSAAGGTSIFGVIELGLTDGAPDYGLTAGVTQRF